MTNWIQTAVAFVCVRSSRRAPLVFAALLSLSFFSLSVQAAAPASQDGAAIDPQHDFDFNFGTWKTHIRRVLDPLAGGTHTEEMNGTVTVHKVWGGKAQIEEIEADGPKGHWEGLTLFLFNPESHEWSQNFVDSNSGVLTSGLVGTFKNGIGQLYSQETYQGRTVFIRGTWSDIKSNSHHFEEAISTDGGATWAPVFIADLTRLNQ